MTVSVANESSREELLHAMLRASSRLSLSDADVAVHETHISWIFLVGEFAYKIKKPIKNDFLDYSSIDQRRECCLAELRLNSRYANDLYLCVVPITRSEGKLAIDGQGNAVEFAVKMYRFPEDALLSQRLQQGNVTNSDIFDLSRSVARFHDSAARINPAQEFGLPEDIQRDAMANLSELRSSVDDDTCKSNLNALSQWTTEYFQQHKNLMAERRASGCIRECHGDLHLENVVRWRDQLVPFDGIEFNDRFRWIDVLSDAAFLAMDFAARDHLEFSRSFINAYLEQSGDHTALSLLRWYLVYRALVRAKVASMRSRQACSTSLQGQASELDCHRHIELAYRFTLSQSPLLWIAHGPSGSGKTHGTELVVQRRGAIRLRSDVERKRHFGMSPFQRPNRRERTKLYSPSANHTTYDRLKRLARGILSAGYSVVVDAAFLERKMREDFRKFAEQQGVGFGILDFQCDPQTLRRRVADRIARDDDASDADLEVLEAQLALSEPLADWERRHVVTIPDAVSSIGDL